jgi:hypothetical protein
VIDAAANPSIFGGSGWKIHQPSTGRTQSRERRKTSLSTADVSTPESSYLAAAGCIRSPHSPRHRSGSMLPHIGWVCPERSPTE